MRITKKDDAPELVCVFESDAERELFEMIAGNHGLSLDEYLFDVIRDAAERSDVE